VAVEGLEPCVLHGPHRAGGADVARGGGESRGLSLEIGVPASPDRNTSLRRENIRTVGLNNIGAPPATNGARRPFRPLEKGPKPCPPRSHSSQPRLRSASGHLSAPAKPWPETCNGNGCSIIPLPSCNATTCRPSANGRVTGLQEHINFRHQTAGGGIAHIPCRYLPDRRQRPRGRHPSGLRLADRSNKKTIGIRSL